jgi:hypothetical protein
MNQTDIEPIVNTGDPDVDSFNADPQAKEGPKINPDWVDAYRGIQIRLTAAEREQAAIIAHGLLAGHPDNPVHVGPRPIGLTMTELGNQRPARAFTAAIDREFAGIPPYQQPASLLQGMVQAANTQGFNQIPENTSRLPQWGQV